MKSNTITVCMGSSCFSRGNRKNLETIRTFLSENNLETEISLQGALCTGQCRKGPVITFDDLVATGVESADLLDLLRIYMGKKREND